MNIRKVSSSSSSSSTQFLLPKVPSLTKRSSSDNSNISNSRSVSHRGNGSSDSGAETSDSDDKSSEYVNNRLRSIDNVVQCATCLQSFSLSCYLAHSARCKGSFLCQCCGATFAQKAYLQRHIARVHSKANCGFLCDICGQILSTNNNLKQHKLIHSHNMQFTCEFCNRGFFQKIHYHSHLDSKHSKLELAHVNKPCVCFMCNETFLFQTSLQQHLNQYCCKKEKRYSCRSCDKSFIYPSELKRHEFVHLSKFDRVYSCPYCQKSYNRLYQFVEHLFFHKNTSAFKCPKCDKILSELSYLKKHYKRHFVDSNNSDDNDINVKNPVLLIQEEGKMDVDGKEEEMFRVDDEDSVALIDNFIEEVWDRFQPYLNDENPQSISFDDLKLDIWEDFLSESNL